jgi:serine/threonine protein kinase
MASAAVAMPIAAVSATAPPKSPPKLKNDKGKLTELHGEPPITIKRNENGYLTRGRMLGEGGFARVYAATDSLTGAQKAIKVISKEQLKSTKTKSKVRRGSLAQDSVVDARSTNASPSSCVPHRYYLLFIRHFHFLLPSSSRRSSCIK